MCIYTHMHTTKPDAHYKSRCYTNSSRGNKVGLLQQITKNKNSDLQWLVISVCSQGMDCNKEKKGTVLVKEEKWAKPSWSNGNAVMFYTISSVLYFSPIDLISVFGYSIIFFKFKWPTTNWVKQLQWKPFSMEDVRSLKTLGLPQNYHV